MRADTILRATRWDPAVVLASIGANMLSLVVPMSMIHLYDRILPNQSYETLAVLAALVGAAILAEVILRTARRVILERAGEVFELKMYPALFDCLVNADPKASDKLGAGRLHSSVGAVDRLRRLHTGETAFAILDLPFACLFLAVIAAISPLAGAIVALILLVTFLVLRTARRLSLRLQEDKRAGEQRRYSFLIEVLGRIDVIKAMQIENPMRRRYERLMGGAAVLEAETVKISHFAQGFTATVGAFSPVIIACLGAVLVIEQQITVGALAAIILLTGRIIQPALRVEAFLAGLSMTKLEREEVEDLLSLPYLREGTQTLSRIDVIELEGFSSLADDGGTRAFENVNLILRRGDCVEITGPSRSASSAFLRLFLGETETHGGFHINGTDHAAFASRERLRHIRYLARDQALLNGTLLDNFTNFQRKDYQDDAIALANRLGLGQWLAQTTDGFDLQVGGNQGGGLSRSMLDIASNISRLVDQPDVLLFDRANASLDRETDRRLLNYIAEQRASRITLICSDRPSYQALADWTLDITPFLRRSTRQVAA
ncbi:MAG: ABC transporter transmembrane domain-containing protein [Pseudomonadota bacterium]